MSLIEKNEIFLLEEIVKKNFTSKYKESILGLLWTILNPLLMMLLFTVLFSTLFNRSVNNYPIYFLIGWIVYMFFTSSIGFSMTTLKSNKNILQKTPAPKHIFVLGTIISEFINFIIMISLLIAIMIITHAPFYWETMFFAIIPIFCLFIMLTGVGLILAIACVYYTDIQHLWTVLAMMFMYASAIFYPMDIIPEAYRDYLMLNPLFWAIDQFRSFVFLGEIPDLIYIINFILLSFIILIFGIIVFKKYENKVTMKL